MSGAGRGSVASTTVHRRGPGTLSAPETWTSLNDETQNRRSGSLVTPNLPGPGPSLGTRTSTVSTLSFPVRVDKGLGRDTGRGPGGDTLRRTNVQPEVSSLVPSGVP